MPHKNKEQRAQYNKDYRERNRAAAREYQRRRSTGFTRELFLAVLAQQGGRCALCDRELSERGPLTPRADHCHDTKTPRGVLCNNCNVAEGHLRISGADPVAWGKRLATYRKSPPARRPARNSGL